MTRKHRGQKYFDMSCKSVDKFMIFKIKLFFFAFQEQKKVKKFLYLCLFFYKGCWRIDGPVVNKARQCKSMFATTSNIC